MVTDQPGICLGVYVADCCAIYLADPGRRAIGLLHSGSKGTELGIARTGVEKMAEAFGSAPGDLVAQLSPCIRPPFYEVDFAAEIARQLARRRRAAMSPIAGPIPARTCSAIIPTAWKRAARAACSRCSMVEAGGCGTAVSQNFCFAPMEKWAMLSLP